MSTTGLHKNVLSIGFWPKISGAVTLDQKVITASPGIPGFAKWIRAVVGGDILVQGIDGRNYFVKAVQDHELFPFIFIKVLSSGNDWTGTPRTTTADEMTWFTG